MKTPPSFATGFLLAARLHRLVAAVWLVWGVIFLPVQVAVQAAVGPQRANLPVGELDAGEELLIFFQIMRPIAVPLSVVFGFAVVLLIAWCVLWHAAVVRWWLEPNTAQVRIAEIIGRGLPVWWRFTRLTVLALIVQMIVMIVPCLPFLADIEQRFVMPLLVCGAGLVVAGTVLVWVSTFQGGWTLGEAGRRSALVAWIRGFTATVRRPVRSLLPSLIWGLSGLGLLVLPVLYDGPMATTFLFVAWLLAAFCMVALFMSYAPPKPAPERSVSPLEAPGPFTTTRFPVMWGEDER